MENNITIKKLLGSGDSYKKDQIGGLDHQKFGVFGKILGLINMLLIFNFPHGLHQFKGDVLVKLKIKLNKFDTKEYQVWVHSSEYDSFMNSI